MNATKVLIEKYLLIWLVLLSGLASSWNRLASLDVFSRSADALPAIIAVTMFAIGWMLPREEVLQVFARWPTVLSGTAVQYIAMPTFAFLLATQRQLTEPLFIGVIMVGCAPGAMASNVLTLTADGNTGYSISLTTVATMVSPLIVPLALQITLGQTVSTAIILSAAIKLCWMVVLPVIVGHLLSRVLPAFEKEIGITGSIIANLAILWIVAFVVAKIRD